VKPAAKETTAAMVAGKTGAHRESDGCGADDQEEGGAAPMVGAGAGTPQMIRNVIAFSTARVRSRVPSLSRIVET
jgi:hypothetical protein